MLKSTNPFDNEDIKNQILGKEGREPIIEDAEVIEENYLQDPNSSVSDIKSIISSAPQLPKSAKNIVMDASALALSEKEKRSEEITCAIEEVMEKYNKEYGLSLDINIRDFSKTLVDVSDPSKRKVLELYVSEVFHSLKPMLLLHILNRLLLVVDYVTDPKRILDTNQLTLADQFLLVEKLISYINDISDIIEHTAVKDSDMVLKKLAEDSGNQDLDSSESKEVVESFMKLFKKDSGIRE